jgi:hypothetical protein
MDQNPTQAAPTPVAAPAVSPVSALEKQIRAAAWIAICLGYLAVLGAIFGFLGLFLSFSALSLFDAKEVSALRSLAPIIGVLSVIGVLSSAVSATVLLSLGKRTVHIRKGLMWKAGDVIADPNIKKYLSYLTLIFGFDLLLSIISSFTAKPSYFSLAIAVILFVFILRGYLASTKLVVMPEFVSRMQTPTYKIGNTLLLALTVATLVLSLAPAAVGFLAGSKITSVLESARLNQSTSTTP